MKFRKKPIVIDAVQYLNGDLIPLTAMLQEENKHNQFINIDEETGVPYVMTLEGGLFISNEDWFIRGVAGEYYPCKPDIFAKTYEPA